MAKDIVLANLPANLKDAASEPSVVYSGSSVTVSFEIKLPTTLASVAIGDATTVKVSSTATAPVDGKACVVALGETGNGINIHGTPEVSAPECMLYSNKEGDDSLRFSGNVDVETAGNCAAGRATLNGGSLDVEPYPDEGCPEIGDPLEGWTPPAVSNLCTYNNFNKSGNGKIKDITMSPGTYCGGMQLSGYRNVTFESGIYIIKDGEMRINSKTTVVGEDVGFYLSGEGSTFTFSGNASIDLKAAADGDMATILIAQDPDVSTLVDSDITGGSTVSLLGILYLPRTRLDLSGNSASTVPPVTLVVADSVDIGGTSSFTFNADFEEAGFPTTYADGFSVGGSLRLVE